MALSMPKGTSRYRTLIILISLFVLIIVSMLLANFYFSSQFSEDATKINLAGRQRMLSQKQAKSIGKLIQAQTENKGINTAFKEVKGAFNLFDTTLVAFTKGGETKGANGEVVTLNAVTKGDALIALDSANKLWSPYQTAVRKLINSDISGLHTLAKTNAYASNNNAKLLIMMDQLTKSLVKNNYSSTYINLVGKQQMLSQRITKTLLELVNNQNTLKDSSKLFRVLKRDAQIFNQTLSLMLYGGSIGNAEKLDALTDSTSFDALNKGLEVWKPLSLLLDNLLKVDTRVFSVVSKANAYANSDNLELLKLMNDLTVALEKDQSGRSDILGYIQIVGIILALVMFGFIMRFVMKTLAKSDAQLEQAVEETDEIMTTINDGLFLIDQDHIIGRQHSASLSSIINENTPAGKNFLSILGNIVPNKTIKVAEEYMDLLYNDRVHADLVGDLNPLNQVKVYFEGDDYQKKVGYLAFDFKRVTKDGNIPHLLVQVEDISQQVILEKQLEETKGAAQEQFDMMLQVLHVQPKVLVQFLKETDSSLNQINAILQQKSANKNHQEKIIEISRYMHRIKGDASGLQLVGFEQKAHEFEDLFAELKEKSDFSGKDFLPVVIKLEEFLKQLGSLRSMIDKLADLKETLNAESGGGLQLDNENGTKMSTILNILVKTVSARQGKNVILNIFNEHLLPENYIKPMHDMLTQLIRNSVVHGIEDSVTRHKLNKTDEGIIAVKFFLDPSGKSLTMKYLDNGKGLRPAEIIHTAIEKGMINRKQAISMSQNDIYSLIFKSGFSTRKAVEKDAGRGVGMDVIYDLVKQHNGSIAVNSVENKIFKIDITLPIAQEYSVQQSDKPVLEEASSWT